MKAVKKFNVFRQINETLKMNNGFFTDMIHDLLINSQILIFRKKPVDQIDQ